MGQRSDLATTEARTNLPKLVADMRAKKRASRDPLKDAVRIGPHRTGGATLIPDVDLDAVLEEREALLDEIELLEDRLIAQQLERVYGDGSGVTGRDIEAVARDLGFGRVFD